MHFRAPVTSRALLLAVVLALPAQAGPLTIKGSDTLVVLTQRWAEAFMKAHPGARLQITGGGSGTGLAALVSGSTDIATSSRPITAQERARMPGVVEIPVAIDGVTFYVHAQNPVQGLSVAQLREIYLGDLTDWRDVGGPARPITLFSRESSSGTYVFVKERLLGGLDFSARAQTLPGTAAVVNALSRERAGIGYGGAAFARGVRELTVDGVAPTHQNVRSGKYPLSRQLFFYLRAPPSGEAKAFVAFCLSPEGQALVTKVGYFPLK